MTAGEALKKDGWLRRNTYDEPKLSELVEIYEEMGFEVRLEPFDPVEDFQCSQCMKADPKRYKTIYTRKK